MSRSGAFRDFALGLNSGYALGDKLRQRGEQAAAGTAFNTAYGDNTNENANAAMSYGNAANAEGVTPEQRDEYIATAQQLLVQGERTADQRMSAGLGALQEHYGKTGDSDGMMRVGLQQRQMRSMDKQDELQGLQLSKAKGDAEALTNYRNTLTAMQDPLKAADYMKGLYNKNAIGGPDHDKFNLEFKPTDGGLLAWQTDKNGVAIDGTAKHYTNEQVIAEAQRNYLAQVDPSGAMKLDIENKRHAETVERTKDRDAAADKRANRSLAIAESSAARAEEEYGTKKQKQAEIDNLRQTYFLAMKNNPGGAKDVADKAYYEHGIDLDGRALKSDAKILTVNNERGAQDIVRVDPRGGTATKITPGLTTVGGAAGNTPENIAATQSAYAKAKKGEQYLDAITGKMRIKQ